MDRYKKIKWILAWLMAANVAVAAAKAVVGYLTGSLGMVADAFHSVTDSANNVIGLIAINFAAQPPDADHPYGHAKFETLATIAVSALLLFAAYNIIRGAVDRFQHPATPEVGAVSFAVMIFTIIINVAVATYEFRAGRRLKSDFLIADSLHTRSDIFVSLSVIVTLGFVRLGYPIVDPIISLVIGGFIAKAGFDIIRRSSGSLTDKAVLDPDNICELVLGIAGVKGCHSIRTRGVVDLIYVDLHVEVDPQMSTAAAHDLATKVEETVAGGIPGVADVVVHIEPFGRDKTT